MGMYSVKVDILCRYITDIIHCKIIPESNWYYCNGTIINILTLFRLIIRLIVLIMIFIPWLMTFMSILMQGKVSYNRSCINMIINMITSFVKTIQM